MGCVAGKQLLLPKRPYNFYQIIEGSWTSTLSTPKQNTQNHFCSCNAMFSDGAEICKKLAHREEVVFIRVWLHWHSRDNNKATNDSHEVF